MQIKYLELGLQFLILMEFSSIVLFFTLGFWVFQDKTIFLENNAVVMKCLYMSTVVQRRLVSQNYCSAVKLYGRKQSTDPHDHMSMFTYFLSFLHPYPILYFYALLFCTVSPYFPHVFLPGFIYCIITITYRELSTRHYSCCLAILFQAFINIVFFRQRKRWN